MRLEAAYSFDLEGCSLFIESHPLSNIFQTKEMYDIWCSTRKYKPISVVIINDNKEILGTILALMQTEHRGFMGRFSSRVIIWGGPLIKNNNLLVLDYILKELNKIIGKKVIYSQFRNFWNWSIDEKKVFKNNGFRYEEHLSIIHDLSETPDTILMKMHKGRRKNIRRAVKQGVTFGEITNKHELSEAIPLIGETYKRIRLPMPDISYFAEAFDNLFSEKTVRFFKATIDEKTIGVRFVLCYKGLIYDWYAASDTRYLSKYPNDFLPWKVMEWGHKNGFKAFDFGGAGKPDQVYMVRDFKLKFGGNLVNRGRFEKIYHPLLMQIGKSVIKTYQRLNHVRQ